jgi:putative integral membrane protein (TIGR02587 family)
MPELVKEKKEHQTDDRRFLTGLARAFAGAILFSFPILMTMEMWWLGFYMHRFRLALFIVVFFPLLIGLSYFDGFEDTNGFKEDAVDAFVAYAVGFTASASILFIFNVISFSMSADEIIGKISLQAVAASIGALVAQSQLRGGGNSNGAEADSDEEETNVPRSYFGEMLLMMIGAIFLSLNIAPTEEIILIAFKMSYWQIVALALGSLLMMHAFVYTVKFRGQEERPEDRSYFSVFLRFSVVGYALVLLISLYLLWTFGRLDGMGISEIVQVAIVLSFPGAIGAAASRLIL